ncbi:MAG: TlpA family protein disulfide reductase [Flavobacterium sp.]|nr:TlpA family protein disulfide reductase [Candidatus Neoflavobacterium equi]
MKKIVTIFALMLTLVGWAQKTNTFSKEALNYTFKDSNQKDITFKQILSKNKGKVVVLDLWASWCSDCIKGMPKVHALQDQFPNVSFVFISFDKTPEAWQKGIEKYNVKGQNYLAHDGMKGVFGKAVALDWIPRYIVLNKKSKIALFKAIEADDTTLISTIKSLQ